MQFDGFDWDEGNWPKCAKHGVSKAEIESILISGPIVLPDRSYLGDEFRYNAVGVFDGGRHIFVVFTFRHRGEEALIRALSARYMHKKEIDAMNKPKALKQFPVLLTDEEAERFVDEADLSEYDFSGFKPMNFELRRKDARVNMRLPTPLLDRIKQRAAETGIPYQRLMRDLMERGLDKAG